MKAYRGESPDPLPTKERLARVLEASHAPVEMIAKARAGAYDDYESDSATPIINLVHDLEAAGLSSLAEKARDGVFDSTKAEAERWFQREGKDLLGLR